MASTTLKRLQELGCTATEMVDAKYAMSFRITRSDRDRGAPKDPARCSVARAVTRAAGGRQEIRGVWVFRTMAYMQPSGSDTVYRFSVPYKTQKLIIHALDGGGTVTGEWAELRAPKLSERLGQKAADWRRRKAEGTFGTLRDKPRPHRRKRQVWDRWHTDTGAR